MFYRHSKEITQKRYTVSFIRSKRTILQIFFAGEKAAALSFLPLCMCLLKCFQPFFMLQIDQKHFGRFLIQHTVQISGNPAWHSSLFRIEIKFFTSFCRKHLCIGIGLNMYTCFCRFPQQILSILDWQTLVAQDTICRKIVNGSAIVCYQVAARSC